MTAPVQQVRAGVLDVAFERHGNTAGWPVLLPHGFPYDPRCDDRVALAGDPAYQKLEDTIATQPPIPAPTVVIDARRDGLVPDVPPRAAHEGHFPHSSTCGRCRPGTTYRRKHPMPSPTPSCTLTGIADAEPFRDMIVE
jgi:hypothetical protein